MLAKTIFEKVISQIETGAIRINYWDEETKIYGKGKPYATIKITNPKTLRDILRRGDLAFGEAIMDNRLIVSDDELLNLIRLTDENYDMINSNFGKLANYRHISNTRSYQQKNIASHYDLGNDFYKLWLDKSMTYTCAYFKTKKDSLETAQTQKIMHVLAKLQLKSYMEFVDIGCGWGHLVILAAKKYKAKGLGVTLSKEQYEYAIALAKTEGVDHLASFKLMNYQDLINSKKKYDRVVSVGIFEHVGYGNHRQYFKIVDHLLKPQGISVLHTITQQKEIKLPAVIDKYIFPGGYIPSLRETISLLPDFNMRLIDVENLRPHYVLTLSEWLKRFDQNINKISKMYDERFIKMWRLYLNGSISAFAYGNNDLSQIVFTKGINDQLPLTRDFLYR